MTIIPASLLSQWSAAEGKRQAERLENLLDLREWLAENDVMLRNENIRMKVFNEAAGAFKCEARTLYRILNSQLRDYPAEELRKWIGGGLGMQHLEVSARIAQYKKMTAPDLLDFALTGNEQGRAMTVGEMTTFVLGEIHRSPVHKFIGIWMERFAAMGERWGLKLGWDAEKQSRWVVRVGELREEFGL